MLMTRIITGIIIVAIIIVGGFALLNNEQKRNDIIALGVLASLGEGTSAEQSPIYHALQIAADEINETGGIHGKHVQLVIEDGKCNAQVSGTAAQKLANIDHVFALFGGECEVEVRAAQEIAGTAGIVMLSPISLSSQEKNEGLFAIAPTARAVGDLSARYLGEEQSLKTIALVRESGAYDTFATHFKTYLKT